MFVCVIKCVDASKKPWSLDCQPLSGCLAPRKKWSLSFPVSWWRENQRKHLVSAKESKIVSPSKQAVLARAVESLASGRHTFLMRNTSAWDGQDQMWLSDTSLALLLWKLPKLRRHPSSAWARGQEQPHGDLHTQSRLWGDSCLN